MAFIPETDFETNVEEMMEAMSTVRTIEISHATHSTKVNDINIKEGEIISLLDGELLAAGDSYEDVIFPLLNQIDIHNADVLTLYSGIDAEETETDQLFSKICELYPGLESGVVDGGQPNYAYIISVE
jgi:dihydroxyacetone kinase-like predicted kinase